MPGLYRFFRYVFSEDRAFYFLIKELTGLYARDLRIFQIAFTHKSASIKTDQGRFVNNERLEYLGDAILDAIVADYLFEQYPDKKEGFLTKMRARIVSRDQLNNIALELDLNRLIVSHIQPKETKNIYGNALEALIGAIYLEFGFKKTKQFVVKKIIRKHIDLESLRSVNTDYKSQIIEWAQKNKQEIVFENEESEELPPNNQLFTSYVKIMEDVVGKGQGTSKKEAQQMAAKEALKVANKYFEE